MSIQAVQGGFERRTAVDDIFDQLRSDIINLRLTPGTKISEAEVSTKFGVSRQPVREAFIRLSNMHLLQVRPQKATLVRKISESEILNARFLRIAVELEVIRKACESDWQPYEVSFKANLAAQAQALNDMQISKLHALDYDFHNLVCATANCEFAYDTIADSKAHVDRLCMISLSTEKGMQEVYQDHLQLYDSLTRRDEAEMQRLIRLHICRLDQTIASARKQHPEYFED